VVAVASCDFSVSLEEVRVLTWAVSDDCCCCASAKSERSRESSSFAGVPERALRVPLPVDIARGAEPPEGDGGTWAVEDCAW
jgi:hypothetical protein